MDAVQVGDEQLGIDDLLSLKRRLTLDELSALWPRFVLVANLLIDSFAGFEARVAELRRLECDAPLLTAEEAAARLAVPESFLRQAGRDGRIKVVNVGSYVRFSQAEIERVKREGASEATAPSRRLTDLASRRGRRPHANIA